MQVRRKTPILEARQFTAESALSLISDGWLSGVEVVDGAPVGLVTRPAGRSRAVPLDGWIVEEQVGDPSHLLASRHTPTYRPIAAEQFTEDFEVIVTPSPDHQAWEPSPITQEMLDKIEADRADDEALRASLKNMPCELVNHPGMPDEAELEEALIEAAAPKAKRAQG